MPQDPNALHLCSIRRATLPATRNMRRCAAACRLQQAHARATFLRSSKCACVCGGGCSDSPSDTTRSLCHRSQRPGATRAPAQRHGRPFWTGPAPLLSASRRRPLSARPHSIAPRMECGQTHGGNARRHRASSQRVTQSVGGPAPDAGPDGTAGPASRACFAPFRHGLLGPASEP